MTQTTVTVFQLIQAKAAIKLEKVGLKHSSGKSVKAHYAKLLGMSPRAKHDDVLARIQATLDELKEAEPA